MMRLKFLFFLFLATGIFASCSKDDSGNSDELIQQYIVDNNLTAEKTPEGLYVVIDEKGTGTTPDLSDEVKVHYRGELLDGTVFDSSYDRGTPAVFPLNGVIDGWQIGIPFFREGGKGKLLIPPSLGYGSNPPRGSIIPRNAVLIFDVELIDVK